MKTDISSDDDFEFVCFDDGEAPAFSHAHQGDTGSTTDTDDLSSVFAESTSASKAKELVRNTVLQYNNLRAWCKTIVTNSFYIRSYNSFAPIPRNANYVISSSRVWDESVISVRY